MRLRRPEQNVRRSDGLAGEGVALYIDTGKCFADDWSGTSGDGVRLPEAGVQGFVVEADSCDASSATIYGDVSDRAVHGCLGMALGAEAWEACIFGGHDLV